MTDKLEVSCSIGSIGLTMLFIVLKLIGAISWSWWWVLAPTWIPVVLVVGTAFVLVIFQTKGSWYE